ncbi:hypothetical protein FNU76_17255 [Chitinimonas arctica]|uniref:Uncharacterized protein n=1 Tax=Chitinimonas arctica TaxID=2594795 RepID=A0A516SIG6_9NEIS|nr:hypothetical protein [Chitinimonas arctica]QDQ27949.1 hypothetical protein FNU76_17255 [Chitinimonas arctica]
MSRFFPRCLWWRKCLRWREQRTTACNTPPVEARLTTINLRSDAGDAIGLGQNYAYSLTNAKISVTSERNRLVVQVEGDEAWTGVFQTGGTEQTQLKPGMVADVPRYEDGMDWGKSGLTWFGEGRACFSSYGWFSIDSVKYAGARLSEIKIRFERHCDGAAAALHGEITFYADDLSKPPQPVTPAPASLWRPPAEVANSTGNYAYFESDDGDYVGLGKTYRYDQRNAGITVSGDVTNMVIAIQGSEVWSAELRGMTGSYTLQPGYYPGVHGSRFHNPVKGGLSWTGVGRGCSRSTGWFVVDSVAFDPTSTNLVSAIDLRFEQHCEGRTAALRGVVHWKNPALTPLPPVAGNTAVGSWRAPAAALPASGNYLYMQSDIGETLGKGLIDLQTSATAKFGVDVQSGRLTFSVHGSRYWNGSLNLKPGQTRFLAGDHANLNGGAFTVSLGSYGQFSPQAWVVIDSISYVDGKVVALDLRFEEFGGGNDSGLLHGQLHWRADQPDNFAGPAPLAPSLFWRPASNATPSAGNYIYLVRDRSDFLGDQPSYLYTVLNSLITVTAAGNAVTVSVSGDELWNGRFETMANSSQIQAGYYAGITTSSSPARGSFSWGGNGRGCNEATSGIVVDKATYVGGQLVELRMRFEQHCGNEPGAMRGEIRWLANDTQQPAGPAAIPAGLWRAPTGALPTSGSYLYVASDLGDPIGQGKTALMTDKDTQFFASTSTPMNNDAYFRLSADSSKTDVGDWRGEFQSMIGQNKFQTGFYDQVARIPFQNRAFGGLTWSANGAGCNKSIGWFVVDKVVYVGDTLTTLHARFEQHCDYVAPALHGELHWEASPSAPAMAQGVNVLSETATRKKMR